ncbi:DUF1307 domain-containing protein [Amedibacillus sp. YH-ame10]
MKKIVAVLMFVALLAGCTGSKETTFVGKGNANGITCEVEFVGNGDKVSKVKEVIDMDLKTLGLTQEQAKATMEPATKKNNAIEGVNIKLETTEEKVIVTSELDCSKANIDELKKAGLVDSTSDAKYVSLKKSKENYEKKFGVVFEEK